MTAAAALIMAGCTANEGVGVSRGGVGAITNAYRVTLEDGGRGWRISGPDTAAVMRRGREVCGNRGTEVLDDETRRVRGFLFSRREVAATVRCRPPTSPSS